MQFRIIHFLIVFCFIQFVSGCAFVAVGSGAAAVTTATVDSRTAGTKIEDQAIEIKVSRAFSQDPDLEEKSHINVTSYNTVVLLSGETPTEAMRQKAVELVENIEKVTHIYNEITMAAPSSLVSRSSDSYITAKVKARMFVDKESSGLRIKVVTEKGVVYLMGLMTRAEAEKATDIARQTGGVQKVVKLFQYTD